LAVRRFAGLRIVRVEMLLRVDCLERRIGAAMISDKRMFLIRGISMADASRAVDFAAAMPL
jgi:hypothetical protein